MDYFFKFDPIAVHPLDLSLILFYLIGILIFGIYIGRGVKTGEDYFIAGRSLPFWAVGLSIIGSNIGSNDYVGAAGGAYKIGIAQANFEWIGAIPAMIICAFFFLPYYWKAGVYSIPEFLGLRYSQLVRVTSALVLSLFTLLSVGVYLWSTAILLKTYLGWPVGFSILVTGIVVGIYTITGGLKAVTITDTVQVGIMFIGAFGLAYLGIEKSGGILEFTNKLTSNHPNHLNAFLPSDHPNFPWHGVILGLAFVLSPAYWCTNQVILQRTLGAKSVWDSQASMILAALGKTLVPFLIVLPGLLTLVLAPKVLDNPDESLPWIIRNILPPGLSGLLFVSFIAALQSSVDSTLNSAATMVTRDIIGVWKPETRRDEFELSAGKWITAIGLILGILLAPITAKFEGIYIFVQTVLSFFQGPMFSIMLFGILSKLPTPNSGFIALVGGLIFSVALGFFGVNMLHIAFTSFLFSTFLLFAFSKITEPLPNDSLERLTYGGKK